LNFWPLSKINVTRQKPLLIGVAFNDTVNMTPRCRWVSCQRVSFVSGAGIFTASTAVSNNYDPKVSLSPGRGVKQCSFLSGAGSSTASAAVSNKYDSQRKSTDKLCPPPGDIVHKHCELRHQKSCITWGLCHCNIRNSFFFLNIF
jgi:hypothetical protein